MNTLTAPSSYQSVPPFLRDPGRRSYQPKSRFGPVAITVMVAAHLLLGYGLTSGLGGKALEVIKKPLQATIVQEEVKLPPPPPPPPPKIYQAKKIPRSIPLDTPPPPSYVPPPEVQVQESAAPAISEVQRTETLTPPPTPTPPVPARTNIALACPKQVAPAMPAKALSDNIEGTVRAQARIVGGQVVEVKILSGPSVFHAAVRAAMQAYRCADAGTEVFATQDFTFTLD